MRNEIAAIAFQRAATEAAQLRLMGSAAAAVATGADKISTAPAAGISRPTLDRWIERAESGGALTVDWGDKPDTVTLDGITVEVREEVVYVPSATTMHAFDNAGRGWVVSTPDAIIDLTLGYDDLRYAIIAPGGVIVFNAAHLDAAVVCVVRAEQERRAARDERRLEHDAAIHQLSAAKATLDALTPEQKQAMHGEAMSMRDQLRVDAQAFYDREIITEDEARVYAGPWLAPANVRTRQDDDGHAPAP